MTRRVKTLRKAEADIRSITNYLYKRSPQEAAAWLSAYRQARIRLADNSESCSEADESEYFDMVVKHVFLRPDAAASIVCSSRSNLLRSHYPDSTGVRKSWAIAEDDLLDG